MHGGRGGSPGQGPRPLGPSSQEGLGQATPGWEAGGTSAAGPLLPLPGAHVEEGCPGDGEPRVRVEPDRGGRAAFPRGGWRRHPGTLVVPGQVRWGRSNVEGDALCNALRWHGSGRVGGAAPSGRVAGACPLPTRVRCQLDCSGHRRAESGWDRSRRMALRRGAGGAAGCGHVSTRPCCLLVQVPRGSGVACVRDRFRDPGPGDGWVLWQARRCSRSEAQPPVAPILERAAPSPGHDRAGSPSPRAAGCAGFRGCQWEAGGRAGGMRARGHRLPRLASEPAGTRGT